MTNISNFFNEIEESTYDFLETLKHEDNKFCFYPAKEGLTKGGKELKLGFSCFGLKVYYILGYWDNLSTEDKEAWGSYINDFQKIKKMYPKNSYIDEALVSNYLKLNPKRLHKDLAKIILNNLNIKNYSSKNENILTSVRAETKQAISTLKQVDMDQRFQYYEFPNNNKLLENFFFLLDWNKPWDAGAQYAGLCVFASQANENPETIEYLRNFSRKIVQSKDGAYYLGETPRNSELVNGAMKVITGLDWIDEPIHYPEKLIDLCLTIKPDHDGCDLVDIVYVLYKCLDQTEYKKSEIIKYFEEVKGIIKKHYFTKTGGFSYFLNRSQTHYYGVKITNGLKKPDLHGTTLLVWALSMIRDVIEPELNEWKIIKP